jgi:hypothetical protein
MISTTIFIARIRPMSDMPGRNQVLSIRKNAAQSRPTQDIR